MDPEFADLQATARKHLPEKVATVWARESRWGLNLRPATEGEVVIGALGGTPEVPEWPVWEGHGPLAHVLTLRCEVAGRLLAELGLPDEGNLHFYYWDPLEWGDELVPFDPDSVGGWRVVHLAPGAEGSPVPEGIRTYPEMLLAADRVLVPPDAENQRLQEALQEEGGDLYGALDDLREEILERYEWRGHLVGGNLDSVQGPVQDEIVTVMRNLGREVGEGSDVERAAKLVPLLQVGSDEEAEMMWGDAGILYYMIEEEDLAAGRFENTHFTWQCC